ncbi:MAG: succinate dehydrogenase, cytochrome b556 subunit [Pseudomonadota bacterium]
MASSAKRAERPLSPHLQVHALPINMLMSIIHRITGAALYLGSALLVWWLVAAASGEAAYNAAAGFFSSWFGMLIMLGYCWALMHHMFGGIRHFIWDVGAGFELGTVDRLAWGTLAASLGATVLLCFVAFAGGGS